MEILYSIFLTKRTWGPKRGSWGGGVGVGGGGGWWVGGDLGGGGGGGGGWGV